MSRAEAWEKHTYFWNRRNQLTNREIFPELQLIYNLAKTPLFQKALDRANKSES